MMSDTACFFCGHAHLDSKGQYCSRCGEFYTRSMRGTVSHYGGALFTSLVFFLLIFGLSFASLLLGATPESDGTRLWPAAIIASLSLFPMWYAVRVLRLRPGNGLGRAKANLQSAMTGIVAAALALLAMMSL